MLPNCAAELMLERPLDELLDWIQSVRERQLQHLSSYADFITYYLNQTSYSDRICGKVSEYIVYNYVVLNHISFITWKGKILLL